MKKILSLILCALIIFATVLSTASCGGKKIAFIKSGAGSRIGGTKNKYLQISNILKAKGFSVICASNPIESVNVDKTVILNFVDEMGFSDYELYFFGASDGAYYNLDLARAFPQSVKLVSVNSSNIGIDEFIEKLRLIPAVEKTLIYGTLDEDFKFTSRIENAAIKSLKIITIDNANHEFAGMTDKFISFAKLL